MNTIAVGPDVNSFHWISRLFYDVHKEKMTVIHVPFDTEGSTISEVSNTKC